MFWSEYRIKKVTAKHLNCGNYIWNIYDSPLLNQIKTAARGKSFASVFDVAKLKWRITIFPNGDRSLNAGYFTLGLTPFAIPVAWKYVVIRRTFEIKEFNIKTTQIQKYSRTLTTLKPQRVTSIAEVK